MPDFRVIDGGGPGDYNEVRLRQHLKSLLVEVLRAVARGDDDRTKLADELVHVVELAGQMKRPWHQLIDVVVCEMNADIVHDDRDLRVRLEDIVLASLPVAAERCASDGAAGGRASQRKERLRNVVDEYVVDREERAREGGGSYVDRLVAHLPPPAVPSSRGSKAIEKARREISEHYGVRARRKQKPGDPTET